MGPVTFTIHDSPPRMLWGNAADLSAYDLSLYLHGFRGQDSTRGKSRLASRRPWEGLTICGDLNDCQLVLPGIVMTSEMPFGVFSSQAIVGIYSTSRPGYFELAASDVDTLLLFEVDGEHRRDRRLNVNGCSIMASDFLKECLFWGGNVQCGDHHVSFNILSSRKEGVVLARSFDGRQFRLPKELVIQMSQGSFERKLVNAILQ